MLFHTIKTKKKFKKKEKKSLVNIPYSMRKTIYERKES